MSLASCVKENPPYNNGVKEGYGLLEMNVNADTPSTGTKALHQVTDYPVIIRNKATNAVVKEWDTVAEVPEKVELEIGNYTIESHTAGQIAKKMTSPYYAGAKDIEIVQYHTTEAEVICKMLNSKISVVYDPLFKETFESWSITLNEGVNTVTTLTHEADESEQVFYWYFQSDVSTIRMDFIGVTKEDGKTIHQTIEITKDKAEHGGYDNDHDTNFTGGDALTFTLKPIFDDKGQIGPITVIPVIDFTDDGNPDDFVVNVEDITEQKPEGGEGPQGGDSGNITLSIPEPLTLELDTNGKCLTNPALGNVNITATKGIKSLLVTISSNNSDFMATLDEMAEDPKMALASGCEVVGNDSLKELFDLLGQEITIPSEGMINYTFPVGNFFGLLTGFDGTHNFEMKVTDLEGASATETVVITVPNIWN